MPNEVWKRKLTLKTATLYNSPIEGVLVVCLTKDNWVGDQRRGFHWSFIVAWKFSNQNFNSRKVYVLDKLTLKYLERKNIYIF